MIEYEISIEPTANGNKYSKRGIAYKNIIIKLSDMSSISFLVSFLAFVFYKGCLFIAIYLGRPCILKTNDKNDFERDYNNRKMLRLFLC